MPEIKMSNNDLHKILTECLGLSNDTLIKLGKGGLEPKQKNQFGDTALYADIAIEACIIEHLKSLNLPARIISEEHGVIDLTNEPYFLVILDGLDGSSVYKKTQGSGRFGTMLAIYHSIDPTYDDYIVCGIIEHGAKIIYSAQKNEGVFVGGVARISNAKTKMSDKTLLYINPYATIGEKILLLASRHMPLSGNFSTGSTAIHYIDLLCNEVSGIIEPTRKNNLELMVAYGLIREAGGIIIEEDGNEIGEKKYYEFGQKQHLLTIAGLDKDLVLNFYNELLRDLHK